MRIGFADSLPCGEFTFIPLYASSNKMPLAWQSRNREKQLLWQELSPKTSADVHVLTVNNNSDETVLIPVGTAIAGGYQDRVVASSVLLLPRSKGNYVSTLCIEKGRWGGKRKPLKTVTSVDGLLKQLVVSTGKQTSIWQYIDNLYQAKGLKANVQPYLAVKPIVQNIPPRFTAVLHSQHIRRDSLIGWAVSSRGRFVAAEAFHTPALYQQVYASTLTSLFEYCLQRNKPILERTTNEALNNLFSSVLQPQYLQQYGKGYYQGTTLFHLICY